MTWQRNSSVCRLLQGMAAMLIVCAADAEVGSFTVEPPSGPASAGQHVKLVFSKTNKAKTVDTVKFGTSEAPIKGRDAMSVEVDLPIYNGRGQPIPGGFVVLVSVNDKPTNTFFTYLNENTTSQTTTSENVDKDTSRGHAHVSMTIDPAYGDAAGGGRIVLTVDDRAAVCKQPQVLFDKIQMPLLAISPTAFEASVPQMEIPQGQSLKPVSVSMRCDGAILASVSFLYVTDVRPKEASRGWHVLMIVSVILFAGALLWRQWSFEKRISKPVEKVKSSQPPPDFSTQFAEINVRLNKIEARLSRSAGQPTGSYSGSGTAGMSSGTTPSAGIPTNVEPVEELTEGELLSSEEEPANRPLPPGKRPGRESSPSKERVRTVAGVEALTSIWNEANGRNQSDQEFQQMVRAALSAQLEFRSDSGLMVIMPREAQLAWVVPAMDPILHRPALREFFEVRAGTGGRGTTLIRPAMMPKDVDINGYTAGQITRGILEK